MTSLAPPPRRPDQDAEHLRLLSVFHYVFGGVWGLFASAPIIHFLIGAALVGLASQSHHAPDNIAGTVIGGAFMLFGGAWLIFGWTLVICVLIAGRSLSQRRRYIFCLVVAGLEAVLCMPFGTVLGVFTIIVLTRPSVKTAFGA